MSSQTSGFKLYNPIYNSEIINKRRKLSIGSEGSDSTGEKLNESFNRLTLSAGNQQNITQSSFQPFVKIPVKQVTRNEVQLAQPQLLMGIQKYLDLGEKLDTADLLSKPFNDLQKIQDTFAAPQPLRVCFIPFGMPANYDKLMAEAHSVLQKEMQCEEERQKKTMDELMIEQKLLNPTQKLTRDERDAKIRAFWDKKHNRQWKQVRYTVRKNLADQRERVQGRFTKSDKPKFNQSLILQDKEDRKMETLTNSYS